MSQSKTLIIEDPLAPREKTIPLSVVIPVYNAGHFLIPAVESILGQTFSDFELIIVDDGSTDQSLEILKAYASRDHRIRIITRANTGVAGARNDGLMAATGEFVAWMDADDISLPNRLQAQYEFLMAHPNIGAVGSAYEEIEESGGRTGLSIRFPCAPATIRWNLQSGRCVVAQTTMMVRRTIGLRLGHYRGLFSPAEDYDLWLRASEIADVANLSEILLLYRIHGGSLSMKHAVKQMLGTEVARRAGAMRRSGAPDPVGDETTISSELLVRVGISESDVQLMHGRTLRQLASNQLVRGNVSFALSIIADYDNSAIVPWVRRELVPEFKLLHARIRKAQGDLFAAVVGGAGVCIRHPLFLLELLAKVIRQFCR